MKLRLLLTASIGCTCSHIANAQDVHVRRVLLTGEALHGVQGVPDRAFGAALTDDGQIAVTTRLTGFDEFPFRREALLIEESPGVFRTLAREREPLPGSNAGDVYGNSFNFTQINQSGTVLFYGNIDDTVDNGLFRSVPAQGTSAVSLPDQPLAGTSTVRNYFGPVALNAQGEVAFSARLDGNAGDVLVSEAGGNGLEVIAQSSQTIAPGAPGQQAFTGFFGSTFADDGRLLFAGRVSFTPQIYGIWQHTHQGGIQSVVVRGQDAPGIGGDAEIGPVLDYAISKEGRTAFVTELTGPGLTGGDQQVLYTQFGASFFEPVARTNDHFSGMPSEMSIHSFSRISAGRNGRTAFVAELQGGSPLDTNEAVFRQSASGVELIARSGEQADSLAVGVLYDDFFDVEINARGQMAVIGSLRGDVMLGVDDLALWLIDASGVTRGVIRKGDLFDVDLTADGVDERQIASIAYLSASKPSELNENGELLVTLGFRDGSSGVFLFAVPAPGGVITGVAAVFLFAHGRRRSNAPVSHTDSGR